MSEKITGAPRPRWSGKREAEVLKLRFGRENINGKDKNVKSGGKQLNELATSRIVTCG